LSPRRTGGKRSTGADHTGIKGKKKRMTGGVRQAGREWPWKPSGEESTMKEVQFHTGIRVWWEGRSRDERERPGCFTPPEDREEGATKTLPPGGRRIRGWCSTDSSKAVPHYPHQVWPTGRKKLRVVCSGSTKSERGGNPPFGSL